MKEKLEWSDLRRIGKTDSGGRWYPKVCYEGYFSSLRPPSRAWPHSYAHAAMRKKFLRWLQVNHPDMWEMFTREKGATDATQVP